MRKFLTVLPLIGLVVGMSACREEPEPGTDRPGKSESTVTLVVGNDQAATKASGVSRIVSEPVDLSKEAGIEGFMIREEIQSLDDLYAPVQEATKGTPVFTENLSAVYEGLGVTAYDTSHNLWCEEVTFTHESGNVWSYDYGSIHWPENGKLRFFVKAPVEADGCSNIESLSSGAIEFDYASPTDDTNGDAVAQKDILFSSKVIDKENKDDNKVLLYHALTGVKFKLGTPGSKNLTIKSIKSVTFTNVKSEGHCKVTPNYVVGTNTSDGNPSNAGGAAATKSSSVADWGTTVKTPASFTQKFTDAEQGVDIYTDGDYDFPESIKGSGSAASDNINNTKATKTFMFIPQELVGAGIDLTIEYTYVDSDAADAPVYTGKVTIEDFGEKMAGTATSYKWQAGELRTYSITVGDRVDVAIDDEVNKTTDHTKSDLQITNTGTATCYMRVAVIGNWFYVPKGSEDETVVAITPCTLTSHESKINSKWIKGSDGFYYYKYPVPGGVTIQPGNTLFSSVTFATEYENKPYNRCELKITIPVQAVRASQVSTAWGSATVAGSTTTIVSQLQSSPID